MKISRLAFLLTAVALSFSSTAWTQVPSARVILVLDASGSMWGQIEGRAKIEIARDVIREMVADWDPSVHLGLSAYGHRQEGDCNDIELLIPPAVLDADAVLGAVDALAPKGKTPLSQAVTEAAQALRHHEEKATVVLVSDGEETCDRDPCEVGRELEAAGVDFTVHVVGFDVDDETTQAQLRCLARETGGRYTRARDASTLTAALGEAVEQAKAPSPPPPPSGATGPAEIKGPATVVAGWSFELSWTGPNANNDYLTLVEASAPDNKYGQYEYSREGSPITFIAPSVPGAYELRYVSGGRPVVLGRAPIEVTQSTATLQAADSLAAGSAVEITWSGPDSRGDYVTIVDRDAPEKKWKQYVYTRNGNPMNLIAPADAGAYEVRYLSGFDNGTLARRPLTVAPSTARLTAPASVVAGGTIEFSWSGPDSRGDFITLVPAGTPEKKWKAYEYTKKGNPLTLIAPSTAGSYELRYLSGEGYKTLTSWPLTVTPSATRLTAPSTMVAGGAIEIAWSGPDSRGDFVTLVEAGTPAGKWKQYEYTKKGNPIVLIAPARAGSYELRYLSGGQGYGTLARRTLTVTASTASLEAPATVAAGAAFEIRWTGPDSRGDFVTLVPAGTPEGKWKAYQYTRKGNPIELEAPAEPGDYEVRYLSGGQGYGTLASRPLRVTPP